MLLEEKLCNGCTLCQKECPVEAIIMEDKMPIFTDKCVMCCLCVTICPKGAISAPVKDLETDKKNIRCESCPVNCSIPEGCYGACQRYMNKGGERLHARELLVPQDKPMNEIYKNILLSKPIITAVGAGGSYPDYIPSPIAAKEERDGIDVLTVVTESPLTYSSILVKIDTDRFIGKENTIVRYKGAEVGHITTEQYGSKMLSLGGINVMKSKNRLKATQLIVAASNGEPFKLKVDGGPTLELTSGKIPVIDGEPAQSMKIACGAAIMGIFGQELKELADEVIVLDSDITGLFSEGHVGSTLGVKRSGLVPKGNYTTPGRYFGTPGSGWGGTDINDPANAYDIIDPKKITPGMTLLILEVTGTQAALFQADEKGDFQRLPLTDPVKEMRERLFVNQEKALTTVMYMGGCGGSARAGVTSSPLKLNQAVHDGSVCLTIGGVEAFVMPGGGINFIVDTGKMQWRSFSWTPSPAVVVPLEYTMRKETYDSLGGRKRELKLMSEILKERNVREWK